jgi:hypothetical protein
VWRLGERGRSAPDAVPLPRPLPVRSSRRGEDSIVLRKGLCHSAPPLPRSLGEGSSRAARNERRRRRGRGPPRHSRGAVEPSRHSTAPVVPHPPAPSPRKLREERGRLRQGASHLPPPRSLWGRAGEGGSRPSHRPVRKGTAACRRATEPIRYDGISIFCTAFRTGCGRARTSSLFLLIPRISLRPNVICHHSPKQRGPPGPGAFR